MFKIGTTEIVKKIGKAWRIKMQSVMRMDFYKFMLQQQGLS